MSDLPQDPRFRKLPYVAGPPFFRFYAGTPLLTRDNVPIGSVFVIDTRARGPPTQFEINLLGIMAKNVMEYLEMRRESEMRKRNQIMSQGLASLVDGRFSIFPLAGTCQSKQPCCVPTEINAASETIPEEFADLSTSTTTTAVPEESVFAPAGCSVVLENTTSIRRIDDHEQEASTSRISTSAEAIFGGRLSYHNNTSAPAIAERHYTQKNNLATTNKSLSETKTTNQASSLDTPPEPNSVGKLKELPTPKIDMCRRKSCCPSKAQSKPIPDILSVNESPARRPSLSKSELTGSQGSSYLKTKSRAEEAEDNPTHEQILHRAANLLRESLDVDYTLFLDAIEDCTASSTSEESNLSSMGTDDERPALPPRHDSGICLSLDLEPNELSIRPKRTLMPTIHSSRNSVRKDASAKMISFSSQNSCSMIQQEINAEFGFRSPACKQLRRLLKRYPEGKLWTFTDEGAETSDDEDIIDDVQNANRATKLSETRFLVQCFPGARQILYAPLFNVEKSIHVAACFCVCLEPTPIFTPELELSFMRAFMNNVSVACNRSSMAAANRLKGDFISSISHVNAIIFNILFQVS